MTAIVIFRAWRKYVSHKRLIDYREGMDYLEKRGYEVKGGDVDKMCQKLIVYLLYVDYALEQKQH